MLHRSLSFFFFFFPSRRRHTRLQGDWSSDVCSSDLYWVPTVTVSRYVAGPRGGPWEAMAEHQRRAFARPLKQGVKIVLGTGVGGVPWTGINPAEEFEYYVEYGIRPKPAVQARRSPAPRLLGPP